MKTTGQLLKDNRERKAISLNEVAIATKINMRTLQAMEAGDLEALPPKTFLRGFVRSYAGFLELDVDSVMNTFYEEMGSTKPKSLPQEMEEAAKETGPASNRKAKASPHEAQNAINPKSSLAVKIGVVAGILLVVVLIFFVKKKMESYENEAVVESVPAGITSIEKTDKPGETTPSATRSPAPAAATAAGGAGSSSTTPAGTPPPESNSNAVVVAPTPTPTPTPSPTPSATATPKPTPKPTATPIPTPSPTSKPSATPAPTPTPPPAEASKPVVTAPTPTPKPSPKTDRAQDIIIEALDNVEVDAQIDGEPVKKFKLKGEQVQSIKARRKVVLKFTDGGAVNLIVNGVERGVPGDLGKPLRVDLP